jgi:enamine deaminase RidA (YjgF/YER057c/UK114 family)
MTSTSSPGVLFDNPPGVHAPAGQYSHVATVATGSELLFIAGQVGVGPDGELRQGFEAQVRAAFENLLALLAAKGLSPANLVRLNYYLTSSDQAVELRRIRRDYLPDPAPVSTALVTDLLDNGWLFEIDAVAVRPCA